MDLYSSESEVDSDSPSSDHSEAEQIQKPLKESIKRKVSSPKNVIEEQKSNCIPPTNKNEEDVIPVNSMSLNADSRSGSYESYIKLLNEINASAGIKVQEKKRKLSRFEINELKGSPASGVEEEKLPQNKSPSKNTAQFKLSKMPSKHLEKVEDPFLLEGSLKLEVPYFVFNSAIEIDKECRACQKEAVYFTKKGAIDKRCAASKRGVIKIKANGKISKKSPAYLDFLSKLEVLKKHDLDIEKLRELRIYPEKKKVMSSGNRAKELENFACQEIFIVEEKARKVYSKKEYGVYSAQMSSLKKV